MPDIDSKPTSEPGVIWITGFSGAGKTTVARKVKGRLSSLGVNAILLDGDDLRAIFAGKWGYERTDRIELSRAYFRLCSTLAAQGSTVIISAVSMYEEIYEWVHKNLDRVLQVYLQVPESERHERDRRTKQLYSKLGDLKLLYDEPAHADLVVNNYGETSADDAASQIVTHYLQTEGKDKPDRGRKTHWQSYYGSQPLVFEPSSFAQAVIGELTSGTKLLEIGCGNGRDAGFFAECGFDVYAIDASKAAIEVCVEHHHSSRLRFLHGTLPEISATLPSDFHTVYSRFCLHAMTKLEEWETLVAAHRSMVPGGRLLIECRSINDPLARLGEVISPTERIHGHYRRFIIADELLARLTEIGFAVISAVESDNLAVLGKDNPVVLRVVAVKRHPEQAAR